MGANKANGKNLNLGASGWFFWTATGGGDTWQTPDHADFNVDLVALPIPTDCDVCAGGVCANEACDPSTGGCVHVDNADPCDDSSACTANDTCEAGACVAGPAVVCDDGDDCTVDSCDAQTACTHTYNPTSNVDICDGTDDNCDDEVDLGVGGAACQYPACPLARDWFLYKGGVTKMVFHLKGSGAVDYPCYCPEG